MPESDASVLLSSTHTAVLPFALKFVIHLASIVRPQTKEGSHFLALRVDEGWSQLIH